MTDSAVPLDVLERFPLCLERLVFHSRHAFCEDLCVSPPGASDSCEALLSADDGVEWACLASPLLSQLLLVLGRQLVADVLDYTPNREEPLSAKVAIRCGPVSFICVELIDLTVSGYAHRPKGKEQEGNPVSFPFPPWALQPSSNLHLDASCIYPDC